MVMMMMIESLFFRIFTDRNGTPPTSPVFSAPTKNNINTNPCVYIIEGSIFMHRRPHAWCKNVQIVTMSQTSHHVWEFRRPCCAFLGIPADRGLFLLPDNSATENLVFLPGAGGVMHF